MEEEYINCYNCAYFFVTWDEKFPKGCRIMGFKSREMPSYLVYKASGSRCLKFRKKKQK